MKTLLLTGSSAEMYSVLSASMPSKVAYCKYHGYELKSIPLGYDHQLFGRRLGFERAIAAFDHVGDYDAVMWIDADAFITNFNYEIDDFRDSDKPFSASLDWIDCTTIYAGNFVLYNTSKLKDLYEEFVQFGSKMFLDHSEQEQRTLNFILDSNPELIHVLPRNYLNSVPEIAKKYRVNEEREIAVPWNENCFLAHLTTIPNEYRIKIMKENLLNVKNNVDHQLGNC